MMSRLIVKGLPKSYEEKQLRELFSFAGEITDAKIVRAKDGRSRQFGFVGFRTEAAASSAKQKIDRTYVNASQVFVEFALSVGDSSIPRPWSKYSVGSSSYNNRMQKELAKEGHRSRHGKAKSKKDSTLSFEQRRDLKAMNRNETITENAVQKEPNAINTKDVESYDDFREVMSRRAKKPIWADGHAQSTDEKMNCTPIGIGSRKSKSANDSFRSGSGEGDEMYQDLPCPEESQRDVERITSADPVALNDAVSDADYFKSKVSKIDNEHGISDEINHVRGEKDHTALGKTKDSLLSLGAGDPRASYKSTQLPDRANQDCAMNANADQIKAIKEKESSLYNPAETGRLFLRNLPFNASEEEIEKLCEVYGDLAEVQLIVDPKTKRSRGLAHVLYIFPENAVKAMAALDGTIFCGRLLHVLPGQPRRNQKTVLVPSGDGRGAVGMNSFKQSREEARKDDARSGADFLSQNSMHLSADAVAETIANKHSVTKAELYGREKGESGAAAVRLAIGEATLQLETRRFLLSHGIDLNKAAKAAHLANANTRSGRCKRLSRTSFLVKNLPARTKESQLEELFEKFGSVKRLILAPSGLLAVVELSNASEAKRAYNGLAYVRFKDAPLYLEWLPAEATVHSSNQRISSSQGDDDPNGGTGRKEKTHSEEIDDDTRAVNKSSVFVKNLNFDTYEEGLRAHFMNVLKRHPEVRNSLRSITIAAKKNNRDPNAARLSMGFGFIEFSSLSSAEQAVKLVQGSMLDGHSLELRLSSRNVKSSGESLKRKRLLGKEEKRRKPSSKLIVRNISFEASAQDLRQLFSAFGQLKSMRLPKKMDGSHRGFGFLEFASKSEAKSAMESLYDAHLYGRHLVIEYADEDLDTNGSLEKLQEAASQHVPESKRRRFEPKSIDDDGYHVSNVDEKIRDEMYH